MTYEVVDFIDRVIEANRLSMSLLHYRRTRCLIVSPEDGHLGDGGGGGQNSNGDRGGSGWLSASMAYGRIISIESSGVLSIHCLICSEAPRRPRTRGGEEGREGEERKSFIRKDFGGGIWMKLSAENFSRYGGVKPERHILFREGWY